jgi:hypothetical protein
MTDALKDGDHPDNCGVSRVKNLSGDYITASLAGNVAFTIPPGSYSESVILKIRMIVIRSEHKVWRTRNHQDCTEEFMRVLWG